MVCFFAKQSINWSYLFASRELPKNLKSFTYHKFALGERKQRFGFKIINQNAKVKAISTGLGECLPHHK